MLENIYTSYYSNIINIPNSYSLYCISRTMPTRVYANIYHINEAKPSWFILKPYKDKTATFEAYKAAYILEKFQDLDKIYSQLESNSVLLCWEADYTYCHRSILANMLNDKYSLNIIEWPNNGYLNKIIKEKY